MNLFANNAVSLEYFLIQHLSVEKNNPDQEGGKMSNGNIHTLNIVTRS